MLLCDFSSIIWVKSYFTVDKNLFLSFIETSFLFSVSLIGKTFVSNFTYISATFGEAPEIIEHLKILTKFIVYECSDLVDILKSTSTKLSLRQGSVGILVCGSFDPC